jgi:single-strand selective monofunctional uracil DNA glycosylase
VTARSRAAAPSRVSERLVRAARRLARDADALQFGSPVRYVYNPLAYARRPHEAYLARFAATRKRVVFLGMNPGPWGMVQTGVPFGAIPMVAEWLGIREPVQAPAGGHPRVAVTGFDCARREVSGMRLWGFLRDTYGTVEAMAREMFVSNYCPLLFLDDEGRNLTPDRIGRADQPGLFRACDRHLREVIDALQPEWLVGVGLFAAGRAHAVVEEEGLSIKVAAIPHPSPANPKSQRDWPGQAGAALRAAGVWGPSVAGSGRGKKQ